MPDGKSPRTFASLGHDSAVILVRKRLERGPRNPQETITKERLRALISPLRR
jgi:hypothetical protein